MKVCNLNYLKSVSPDNPGFVTQMIHLFLKNAPQSVESMKSSFISKDWNNLQHFAHKIRSDINCMGISKQYISAAKQIEEHAKQETNFDSIPDLLLKLENIIQEASKELNEELEKKLL
jgi:HPt (histidine-containing phosphotransfer) domain-containing protein